MWTAIKSALSAINVLLTNSRDSELKADGARKVEIERRDKGDEIRKESIRRRKVNNSSTDDDVLDRL